MKKITKIRILNSIYLSTAFTLAAVLIAKGDDHGFSTSRFLALLGAYVVFIFFIAILASVNAYKKSGRFSVTPSTLKEVFLGILSFDLFEKKKKK